MGDLPIIVDEDEIPPFGGLTEIVASIGVLFKVIDAPFLVNVPVFTEML